MAYTHSMKKATVFALSLFLVSPLWAGDPLKKVAKKMAKGAKTLESRKVAVLSFPYHNGAQSSGSSFVPERLITYLSENKTLQVVERSLLHKVLEEMEFQQISAIDKETAKELGKFLGVDSIVTGSLFDHTDGKTEVNARLIKAETGEILASKQVFIKRTWADEPVLPQTQTAKKKKSKKDPEKVIVITNRVPGDDYGRVRHKGDEGRSPNREMVFRPSELARAKRLYSESTYPREKAMALLKIGKINERNKRYPRAREAYQRVIDEFPQQRSFVKEARQRLRALKDRFLQRR